MKTTNILLCVTAALSLVVAATVGAADKKPAKVKAPEYGVIATDQADADTCADKDACMLMTRKSMRIINDRLERAEEERAKAEQKAEATSRCT